MNNTGKHVEEFIAMHYLAIKIKLVDWKVVIATKNLKKAHIKIKDTITN